MYFGAKNSNVVQAFIKSGLIALVVFYSDLVQAEAYSFGVVPLRSAVLTAQYWNPILEFISRKTGVTLQLEMARSVAADAAAVESGAYDFNNSYLIFRPAALKQKYNVILRSRSGDIRSQIVALENSPIKNIKALAGREVGFPSKSGFIAYALPMDHLLRQGVNVKPVFGGNQEGILGQLKAGQVSAVGVSSQVIKAYATRENLSYKIIWESAPYKELPISAHPRVPKSVVNKIQEAFVAIAEDDLGKLVLEESAAAVGQKPPFGFIKARAEDYRQFSDFYHSTLVKDLE